MRHSLGSIDSSSCRSYNLLFDNLRQGRKLSNRSLAQFGEYSIKLSMRQLEDILNRRLREILRTRKMNQRELADLAGMDPGYLSMLLNKKKRWNLENLESIVSSLRVPVWHLFADPSEVDFNEYMDWKRRYAMLDETRRAVVDDMLLAAETRAGEGADPSDRKTADA